MASHNAAFEAREVERLVTLEKCQKGCTPTTKFAT